MKKTLEIKHNDYAKDSDNFILNNKLLGLSKAIARRVGIQNPKESDIKSVDKISKDEKNINITEKVKQIEFNVTKEQFDSLPIGLRKRLV